MNKGYSKYLRNKEEIFTTNIDLLELGAGGLKLLVLSVMKHGFMQIRSQHPIEKCKL